MQVSIVSPEARKALDAVKYRSNAIKRSVWVGTVRWTEYIHGQVTRFDRRMIPVNLMDNFVAHGVDQKLGDTGALEVADFPDIKARVAEAYRRECELIAAIESGSWTVARKAAVAYVPTEDDVREVLAAIQPAHAETLLKLTMAEVAGDAKAGLAKWTATKEGAAAWATIQANRRTATADSADDMVARMLAAAQGG